MIWPSDQRAWRGLFLTIGLLGLLLATGIPHHRPLVQGQGKAIGIAGQNLFLAADRSLRQWMRTARNLLEEKRYAEAIGFLQRILDHPDDFFQPPRESQTWTSFKREAQDLIGRLPPEGLEAYRLQFEASARRLLQQALAENRVELLEEASRRYFHTLSGYRATYQLGRWHLSRGQTLAALVQFMRLEQCPDREQFEPDLSLQLAACWYRLGYRERAAAVVERLRKQSPQLVLSGAGRPIPLPPSAEELLSRFVPQVRSPSQAADHADRWLMVRGNPARNAPSPADVPISDVRWRIPLTTDPELLEKLHVPAYPSQETPTLPAVQPLVVNDQVLVRTAEGLVAVDFHTGKRIWQVAEEIAQAGPGQAGAMEGLMLLPNGAVVSTGSSSSYSDALRRRLLQDLNFGTISSDGRNVYLVQSLPLPTLPSSTTRVFLPNGRAAVRRNNYNLLQARSLAQEGKLLWEVGGPEDQNALPLAGTFFLGPPLPLDGMLFVIGEQKEEIRLFALEATTGRLLWSQHLVVVEQNLMLDPLRRMAGVSPTYADGVLICPTAAGAVVALDLPTRSLRWGFVYQRAGGTRRGPFGFRPFPAQSRSREGDRWLETVPIVAGDLVLITPPETNELVALDLLSGQVRWKAPRQDGLFIGGVQEDRLVVVGMKSARTLQLRDGKLLHTIRYPEGHFPSGRGLLQGGRYLLPLSRGLVVVLDLPQGTIARQYTLRHGQQLGNLVSYRGSIVSVGADFVDCYYQQSWLQQWVQRRLQQDAQDPTALAWQGALLIDQGKLEQAREYLARAYQRDSGPLARQLLLESSLKLLKRDYRKYASLTEEIRRLIIFPEERVRYLLTLAAAHENAGQWDQAFDTYHRLAQTRQELDDLIPTADGTLVRQQRWLAWRLAAVYRQVSGKQRQQLDEKIQEQLQRFLAQTDSQALSQFLTLYGFHPLADRARDALLKRLQDQGATLQRELLLRQLARSSDSQTTAQALFELAQLFDQAGRSLECAWELRQLRHRYPKITLENGNTITQAIARFSLDATASRIASGSDYLQPVRWKTAVGSGRPMTERFYAVPVEVAPDSSPGVVLMFDQHRRTLVGLDGLGRTLWKVPLTTQPATGYISPNIIRARAYGNLILFSMGYQVYAIDAITGNGRLLWKKDLRPQTQVRPFGIRTQMIGTPWGERFHYATDNLGRPVGLLGPVLPDQVHIQVGTELMALEPLTGKVIWKRDHIASGSVVLGDEKTLIAIPPGGGPSLLLETATGKLIKRVTLPNRFQGIVAVSGAHVVLWKYRSGKIHLEMFDPREEKILWQRTVPNGTKAVQFTPTLLALLDPKGGLLVLQLPQGNVLIEQKVKMLSSLMGLHAVVQGEQILVVANSRTRNNAEIGYVSPIPGGSRCLQFNGYIHCFSRSDGKHLWSTRVQHQGLMLSQPWAMPVLVLASHIYRRFQGRGATYHAVACIDRRTGKLVFEEEFDGSVSSFQAFGDPQSGKVTITVSRRITLTPEPLGAKPPAGKELPAVAPPASKSTE